jgi:hypothetical protein
MFLSRIHRCNHSMQQLDAASGPGESRGLFRSAPRDDATMAIVSKRRFPEKT